MRPNTLRSLALVASMSMATILEPNVADAQIGGFIKKKAQEKAAEKAAEKIVDKATGSSGAAGAAATYEGKVEFDAEVIEITAPVLDRFVTAYKAEKAEAARLATLKKKEADLAAAKDQKEMCVEKEQKAQQKVAADLATRMQDAAAKNDAKAMVALQDTLMRMSRGELMKSACGGTGAEEQEQLDQIQNAESGLDKAGAAAGNFSFRQYAILRERIAGYVLGKAKSDRPTTGLRYTAGEIKAMDAKMSDLTSLLGNDFDVHGLRTER